jgi:hypothetical protein
MFLGELTALRLDLQAALNDVKTSRTSLSSLTNLYDNSLTRIANLETYNQQIGERMQDRDQDLAMAYQELDVQDKTILKQKNTILKLIIAVSILGLIIIGSIILAAVKGYFKAKLPIKL